jgi:WD40 repeat protein
MRRLKQVVCCLAVLIFLGTASPSAGATYDLLNSISNPAPQTYGGFGNAVAGVSDRFVVAAVGNGTAYAFDKSGNPSQVFQNPTGGTNNWFGTSVANSNENSLVGAPYAIVGGLDAGAAYLFGSDGTLLRTLSAPTSAGAGGFGYSLGVNGTKVLVGAPFTGAGFSGAVYLFDSASGDLIHTFSDPAQTNENFGLSVAWVGDNILVGASNAVNEPWHNVGAAYLLNQSGDILQTFHSPGIGTGEYFGTSVAGIGNNILVGAPGWQNYRSGTIAGAVYLFNGDTGQLVHTFQDPAATPGDLFGVSMATVGTDQILIGAAYDNTIGQTAGAAYQFDFAGNLLHTYYPPSAEGGSNRFGSSVAAVGNDVLIGAPGNGDVGAVYLYQGAPEPSTLTLLGVGAISLLTYTWRRRWH